MSFQEFFGAIESEALREVAQHWNEVRGSRPMPGWQDIKPAAIRRHLPILWAWKFDAETESFVGRIAGDRIQSAFGTNLRGAKMNDIFQGRDYRHMLARHKRTVTSPELFLGKGLVFLHLNRFDIGERIIMPLSDSGAAGDGIFGATEFKSHDGPVPDDLLRKGEIERWFLL